MHELTAVRTFMDKETRGSHEFYIKHPNPAPARRDPQEEQSAYHVLSRYLRMPKARLAHVNEEPVLVVSGIEGKSVEDILETDPLKAARTTAEFLGDMYKMWAETAEPTDETKFVRNLRTEGIDMLNQIKEDPNIARIGNKRIFVNGIEYPALNATILKCRDNMTGSQDPVMVVRHGDEQLGNIIANGIGYYAIDPDHAGLGSPAQAANVFIGSSHIFYFHWDEAHAAADNFVNIIIGPQDRSIRPMTALSPLFAGVEREVTNISGGQTLLKDYLFVNFMRAAIGKIGRTSDCSEVLSKPYVHIALANQAYYGDLIK